MSATRYPWIDFLKALGIILVVAGHTHLPPAQHRWIYAFHMPLFFMVSGFLMSPGAFSVSLREFFVRRIWKLAQLYAVFGILALIYYCYAFKDRQSIATSLFGRISSLIYASGSKNNNEDLYPVVLWYFPGLISALLLVFCAWQIPWKIGRFLALLAIVTAGVMMSGVALPWELESGCIAAGWIAIGHGLRILRWDEINIPAPVPVGIAAVLVGSALAVINPSPPDLRIATLGNPWLSLPSALFIVCGLVLLFKRLPSLRVITATSAATILIFPTHTMVFPYVDRLAIKATGIHQAVLLNAAWYLWFKAVLVVAFTVLVHIALTIFKAHHKNQKCSPSHPE